MSVAELRQGYDAETVKNPTALEGAAVLSRSGAEQQIPIKDWTGVATNRPTAPIAQPLEASVVTPSPDIERFYADVLRQLGEFGKRGGTGIGAAAVVKRVALEHGVQAAERLPLPRMTRSQQIESGVAGISRARARRAIDGGR